MSRAVSTVLDASLCLLLVSASALALVGVPSDAGSDPSAADETADLLATTTSRVSYVVDGENRTAHDTLAGLLATAAAVSDRGGDSQSIATERFERAVTEQVNRTLRRAGSGTQVVARRGTRREGSPDERVVAGGRPPSDADVHAAAFSVSSVHLTVRTWSG